MGSKTIRNFLRSSHRRGRGGLLLYSPHPPPPPGDSTRVFTSSEQGGKGGRGPHGAPGRRLRGPPPLAPARSPTGETRTRVRAPHSPCSAREPHGKEGHCQHPPGPGVSATSVAADSCLEPGGGMSTSGSPDSSRLAAPVSSTGRIAQPAISPRPPRRLAPAAAAPLLRSSGPRRWRCGACACGPFASPPPPRGTALVLCYPLTFRSPRGRPAASQVSCGARAWPQGVHPSAAVWLDWRAAWSHPCQGTLDLFLSLRKEAGTPAGRVIFS